MIPGALATPPLGLYVHLPWCVRKCPYCDFNSYQAPDSPLPEAAYIDALLRDLDRDLPDVEGRGIETVFFGGGTPSLFQPESYARLLGAVRARAPLAVDAEITLEANPGTIERGRFAGYRDAGINRVSLGAQSFSAEQLAALGRIHTPEDTGRATTELRAAGFTNYNLDLMYALPGQTADLADADVGAALALAPAHLSYYHLTLEPGTAFHRKPPPLPDEDVAAAIEQGAERRLVAEGYRRYEVSAWSRPGHQCRHNLNYWRFGDYLGIGAGAHGKLTLPARGEIIRTAKPRQPAGYLHAVAAAGPVGERALVPPASRPFEFMLNAMRLAEGFDGDQYEARTGLPLAALEPTLTALAAQGLLEPHARGWRATARGWAFLNDVQVAFLES